MEKKEEAKKFLKAIGMPVRQQSDVCAYSLLALADIKPEDEWDQATNKPLRIHDILKFTENVYGVQYAENSRETFRKVALHYFYIAANIDYNTTATNSPNYKYNLTPEALKLIRSLNSDTWEKELAEFVAKNKMLKELLASKKHLAMLPVKINNSDYQFSPGKHNQLQKAIIEEFAPRFAPSSECLYVGDTVQKNLVKLEEKLGLLGFTITQHDIMPDVVLYRSDKDWLYFIEAVTSVGPMSPKRKMDLLDMTKDVKSPKIFITAFLDFKTYKRFADSLAWDTEVWIAELPDHMIHLNGDKFLGPR